MAKELAFALEAWGKATPLPRRGASFSVSVSLFMTAAASSGATRTIPLLTLDRIDLNVPEKWPAS